MQKDAAVVSLNLLKIIATGIQGTCGKPAEPEIIKL
jgi:hypothetical protein